MRPHMQQSTTYAVTETSLTQSWPQFSAAILALINTLGLDTELTCDHVALRVNSHQNADMLSQYFARQGQVISNNMINGRPILIIKLNQSLNLGHMQINCVELPYPGEKSYPQQGWEHIELVFKSTATSCQQLADELITHYPHLADVIAGKTTIKVKMSSPQGEHERLANPTIAFKQDGLCIKIHTHTIEAIIASEQA